MMIICPICSNSFHDLSNHLKKHELTKDKFLNIYPNISLFSEEYLLSRQKAANIRSKNSYDGCKKDTSNKYNHRKILYDENPTKCSMCDIELDYKQKNHKFCNTCAHKYSRSFFNSNDIKQQLSKIEKTSAFRQ